VLDVMTHTQENVFVQNIGCKLLQGGISAIDRVRVKSVDHDTRKQITNALIATLPFRPPMNESVHTAPMQEGAIAALAPRQNSTRTGFFTPYIVQAGGVSELFLDPA